MTRADNIVVFVCQHGAFRSRMAAAYFNQAAPDGWSAISAGVTPQAEISDRLAPLMAGTGAENFIDDEVPRALPRAAAARMIAIDADLPGAELWRTTDQPPATDEQLRDEIRERVTRLVSELATTTDL